MRKILILAVAIMVFGISASAQLTTGTPSAKEYTIGNRAQSGDFGIYLGWSSNMFKDLMDSDIEFENPMPLVNLKYMMSDQMELRVGLEFYKTSEKIKGKDLDEGEKYSCKIVKSENRITPGFAYHFSNKNILDVYAGAQGLIGWSRNVNKRSYEGDKVTTSRKSIDLGVGGVIGLQAYIANLPIALGIEYGINLLWEAGLKYKYKDDTADDDKYYSVDSSQFSLLQSEYSSLLDMDYEKVSASKGSVGNTFAVTLTYFFKN